jgi:hypothetical protein
MLPTFSRRATHLRTLTPSLPYAKHSTPDAQNEPKRSDWQTKVSENRIGEAPGFGFRILLEAQKPAVSKNRLVHCIRLESGVRYQSAEKSREFCCGRRYWP